MEEPRTFKASYSASCKVCGQEVKGQQVTWIRTSDATKKGYVHKHCWQQHQSGASATYADPQDLGLNQPSPVSEPTAPHHNGMDSNAVMDLLSRAIWERIESRVKSVEQNNDELAANVEAQLEAFKSELLQAAQSLQHVVTTVNVVRDNAPQVTIDNAHKMLPILIDLITRRRNIYLWDATGGGKSHAIPQAATALGLRCSSQSYNSQSPDYLLTGYNDANGKYVPSVFYDFFKNGGVYVGEELDDGSADLLVTLNVALANGHMTFPNGERVEKSEDFVFVGCGNTPGRGPTPRYPERKPFDAAFANRFVFVRWTYDEALEMQVALAINPGAGPYVRWVHSARTAVENLGLRLELTPRTSYTLAELSKSSYLTDNLLLDGVLAGIDETAKEKLLENCAFPARS